MRYDYPGNVRELENIIEHAFVLCPGGLIEVKHLPPPLQPQAEVSGQPHPGRLADVEVKTIVETLARHNWNQAAAAKELGIHKTTLWRKLKRLGIRPPRAS